MKKYLILVLIVLLIGALTVGVLAGKKGFQPLDQIPVYYDMFQGVGDDPIDFSSVWSGYDPDGTYWDTSLLRKSAGGQPVHDVLEFFQSHRIKRHYFQPYVLIHSGGGFYSSQGQVVNYQFTEEFGGKSRRAVVTTWLQLDEGGQYDWMVLRADYYTRAEGRMKYFVTNIYPVWDAELGDTMPDAVSDALTELIESGPANVGAQCPIAP